MKMQNLQDLYVDELKDIYDAENQLIKFLPKMAKAAKSSELRSLFEDHLEETQVHVDRLEEIFDRLEMKPKGKKCKGIEGLIAEAKEMLEEDMDDDVLNAALIAAAQKVEHYEIASYGCVRTYAEQLGRDEEGELLQETLDEEKDMDERFTEIAVESINLEAEETEEA